MTRLTEILAHRRYLYSRPLPTLPDILVIDVPPPFAHPSLPRGRFYGIMVETDEEREELEAFLSAERVSLVPPDLLDRRPSCLVTARITIVQYAPPAQNWPWVLLCHWRTCYASIVPAADNMFARGAYTTEMFETEEALLLAADRLVETLARTCLVNVSVIVPERLFASGRA